MDLNIRLKPSTQDRELGLMVKRVAELGWSGMAWNQTAVAKAGQRIQTRPRAEVLLTVPEIHALLRNRALVKSEAASSSAVEEEDAVSLSLSGGKKAFAGLRQLNRLTVTVDEVIDASVLTTTNEALKAFDIVAATTNDAKVFAYLCKVADIDVIALDFTRRIPFPLNKKVVDCAVRRGITFEIRYSPVFHAASARKEIFAGTRHLIKILRGRNIILCSGAEGVAQVRGVHEAINVGMMMKMNAEQAHRAILQASKDAVQHGIARKNRFLPLEVVTPEQFDEIFAREFAPDSKSLTKKRKAERAREEQEEAELQRCYPKLNKKRPRVESGDEMSDEEKENTTTDAPQDEDDGFLKL